MKVRMQNNHNHNDSFCIWLCPASTPDKGYIDQVSLFTEGMDKIVSLNNCLINILVLFFVQLLIKVT